jgi:TPR repeat protein
MGHRDEAKMDELKKLLRRLDGLDTDKSLAKGSQGAGADQRGYVGALRGAPVRDDEDVRKEAKPADAAPPQAQYPPPGYRTSGAAVYVAAATAAVVSTILVFLLLSWQRGDGGRRLMPEPASGSPGRINLQQPASGGDPRRSTDTADGLVRRAEALIGNGEIEAGRALLQRAAELGSGSAALKLGRSYDPTRARPLNFADSQSNPALAKAWYERALALGTQEAAEYLGPPPGR